MRLVLVSVLFALGAVSPAWARDSNFKETWERHLRDFMVDPVNYSLPEVNKNYVSDVQFRPRGMGGLYNVTKLFMKIIQKPKPFPEGFLTVQDGRLHVAPLASEWRYLLAHYGGVVAVVAVGVVFVAVLPFAALFFFCCRCSGRCGSRSQPFDKRHDRCKRVLLGVLLSCLTIVVLFGVVCSFVNNEYMQSGIMELAKEIKKEVNDTHLYLNNTELEVHNLLLTNYKELQGVLNAALDQSGEIISNQLAEMSNAVSLQSLDTLVSGLREIQRDMKEIKNLTTLLQANALDLNSDLSVTRANLQNNLRECNTTQPCKDVLASYNIGNLSTDADFKNLPDISSQLMELNSVGDIESGVARGKREFQKIQRDIQRAVDDNIPHIRQTLRDAGEGIAKISTDLDRIIAKAKQAVSGDQVTVGLNKADELITEYSPFRYYAVMGMNVILLLIFICLTFGLFYGFCGRRPDGAYGDDCCNKASGAKCLMIAVWLALIFGAILMALTVAFFLIGIVADRVICEPLQNPTSNQIMSLMDQLVKFENVGVFPDAKVPKVTVSQIISSCHRNNSIYSVLDLENVVNISKVDNYEETYHISEKLEQFRQNISFSDEVELLDDHTIRELETLAQSEIGKIDFPAYTTVLKENIVTIDLLQLASTLNKTAKDLRSHKPPVSESIINYFNREARKLVDLQESTVTAMQHHAQRLQDKAGDLEDHLKFNDTSLEEAVGNLLKDLASAQQHLDHHMGPDIEKIAKDFTDKFLEHVDNYLNRVIVETKKNVGRCGPISHIYNSTVVATCDTILNPFNGFWASFGWCLLLFIPMIFLSVKLASLYQKSDPYPGPLVESEYLYDAYADHDNIPLANVNDKKNHHRSYHETYDNSSGYMGEYRGPGGHSQARYTDMAPKHWDYPSAVPANGSPRYHSPPLSTEYERPPPYYYPGPGDHQR